MFSGYFLLFVLVILRYINISLALEATRNDDLLLQLKLKDYDIKFAEMEKIIAVQDRKLEQQNVQFAEHNRETLRLEILMEREKTKFTNQNRQIEVQNTIIANQNTMIANQNTMITELNTKLCELKSQIKTLQTSETKIIDQLTAYSNLSQDLDKIKVTTTNLTNQIKILSKIENSKVEGQLAAYYNLSQDLDKIKVKTEDMKIKILSKIENSSNDNAVIFTRWGRSDCPPSTSTQVYNGTTGGGHYTYQGASVNYVCMPHEPLYNKNKKFGVSLDYLYGAEYEADPQSSLKEYEVPCVVCRAAPYSTKLMIPGRNKCYPGWHEAYHGELRSGYHGHKAASEYICLDQQAQRTGKPNNANGKLLYPVRAKCGSLPCPPYESDTLVTCVVCIK